MRSKGPHIRPASKPDIRSAACCTNHSTSDLSAIDDEEVAEDDVEPGAAIDDHRLATLIEEAEALAGDLRRDPKYASLKKAVEDLVDHGYRPVVFCRYIATAKAVGDALALDFKDHAVDTVTGELPSDEREAQVEALVETDEKRILVATDCLSEGINLQSYFDAVVHYDLSWNPTRHQQREGRVDRFGQKAELVRTVLIYGENNPIDGAVLDVILREARQIERRGGLRTRSGYRVGAGRRHALSASVQGDNEVVGLSGRFPMTTNTAAVNALKKAPLFSDLSDEEVGQIAGVFKVRRFSRGDTIVKEGLGGAAFFVIETGEATVTIGGKPRATLAAGDFFGEIALFDEGTRTATITASTDMVCYGLTYWDFRPLVERKGVIGWKLLQRMAKILRDTRSH